MNNNYKSAIEKIKPSEQWKSDTLEKMLAAKAAKSKDDSDIQSPSKSRQKPVHFRYKTVIAAAAIAVIALPLMYFGMFGSGIGTMSAETDAYAFEEAMPEAAVTQEAAEVDDAAAYTANGAEERIDGGGAQAAPQQGETTLQSADEMTNDMPVADLTGGEAEQKIVADLLLEGFVTEITEETITIESDSGEIYVCTLLEQTIIDIDGEILGEYVYIELSEAALDSGKQEALLISSVK